MTSVQKRLLLLLSIVVGLTRFLAIARAPFDWDEALFALGVRDYDVVPHHPHPPGYPLFVAAAKAVHLFGIDEFRALQTVVLLGAFLVFPALVFLAREIGFDFPTSLIGAGIFAFLPNVWIYSGTAFSDVPATAIAFGACALLLRGRRDSRAYVLGAILLGIAAGIRPPNLVIGALPALLATWYRVRARAHVAVVLAIVVGAAVVAASYLGAALASTSLDSYAEALRVQSEYVREVDSFRNPGRPPLAEVAKIFFLMPIQQRERMIGIAFLVGVSLLAAMIERRSAPLLVLAIFGPFAILAWLNLDMNAAGRYAISYLALHALLAADGLRAIGRSARVQSILAVVTIGVFIAWTWPALHLQRNYDPPHVSAIRWVQRNVSPSIPVYVHGAYGPHVQYYLSGHNVRLFVEANEISRMDGASWIVDARIHDAGMNFAWPHKRLSKILRHRNFECSLSRVASMIEFGEGWHLSEGSGGDTIRWMAKSAEVTLPSFRGEGRLALQAQVPLDGLSSPPAIEIHFNGALVDRIASGEALIDRSWIVPSRYDALNELRIATSATINPSRAGKSSGTPGLGLRVDSLTWTPVR